MNVEQLLDVLSQKSKIFDLEHIRYPGMPAFAPVQPGLMYFLHRHHESYYKPSEDGPRTSASGIMIMSDQSGTHIDALSHQASNLTFSNGLKVSEEVETPWGFTKLGSEEILPIITRGLLVDVAKFFGDPMPEKHQITDREFTATLEKEDLNVKNNDVVLVRTGYGKYWKSDPEKYTNSAAGISKEVTLLLKERRVRAVGADNLAWDLPSFRDPETKSLLPGHLKLIAESGIHIIENLNLEELSEQAVYEFIFIGLPLKFKGATGSPLRPIAIKPS